MNTPRTLATIHLPATVQELQTILAAFPRHAKVVHAMAFREGGYSDRLDIEVDPEPEQTGDVVSRQLVLNKLAVIHEASPGAAFGMIRDFYTELESPEEAL
jgi:hypothetical protein